MKLRVYDYQYALDKARVSVARVKEPNKFDGLQQCFKNVVSANVHGKPKFCVK